MVLTVVVSVSTTADVYLPKISNALTHDQRMLADLGEKERLFDSAHTFYEREAFDYLNKAFGYLGMLRKASTKAVNHAKRLPWLCGFYQPLWTKASNSPGLVVVNTPLSHDQDYAVNFHGFGERSRLDSLDEAVADDIALALQIEKDLIYASRYFCGAFATDTAEWVRHNIDRLRRFYSLLNQEARILGSPLEMHPDTLTG
jgi:hypothetical protein